MNAPASVAAGCRAELEILGEHTSSGAFASSPQAEEHCIVCKTPYPCPTICALHSGYRHYPKWKPW
jgi:hypothetical protein